jgi:hypothetical protein
MDFSRRVSGSCVATAAALIIGATSACSGGGGGDDGALSRADAADRYVQLTSPVNAAVSDLAAALDEAPTSVPDVHDAAVALVKASEDFAEVADTTAWPTPVDDDVDRLLSSDHDALVGLRALEDAKTTDDLQAWAENWGQRTGDALAHAHAAASKIRRELGLPPAVDPHSTGPVA